jgi:hypothetical protein
MEAQLITQGTLQTREGRSLPLERTEVRGSVTGAVADITVRQVFRNDDTRCPSRPCTSSRCPTRPACTGCCFASRTASCRAWSRTRPRPDAPTRRPAPRAAPRRCWRRRSPASSRSPWPTSRRAPPSRSSSATRSSSPTTTAAGASCFRIVAPERYRDPPPAAAGALAAAAPCRPGSARETSRVEVHRARRRRRWSRSVRPRTRSTARCTDDGVPVVSIGAGRHVAQPRLRAHLAAPATRACGPWLRFERHPGQPGHLPPRAHTLGAQRPSPNARAATGDLKALKCGNCGGAVIPTLAPSREIPGPRARRALRASAAPSSRRAPR